MDDQPIEWKGRGPGGGVILGMETGVVSSSQLRLTGRMDAPFNLALAKHRAMVNRLVALGRPVLNRKLRAVPSSLAAVRAVARGGDGRNAAWKPGPGYSDIEAAVYVAVAVATADAALLHARRRAVRETLVADLRRGRIMDLLA